MVSTLNFDYPNILGLFKDHLDPKRTESASFLIWYLENYYRLDTQEAVDSVCDQRGDKGVDGIYVNDSDETIDIFQARLSQSKDTSIGDAALKEFFGTLSQFTNSNALENLIATGGDAEVVRLIKRLDLINKIKTYEVRGIFISNVEIDGNGIAYLATTPQIEFIGRKKLTETFISGERTLFSAQMAEFDVSGFTVSSYIVDADTRAVIAPVKAKELVNLQGISDQSLFALNVRGPLGRTKVDRDIVLSIRDPKTHRLFPLFHNGINVICTSIKETPDKIAIENYFVVNGCQSLNALYENKAFLTDDLRVLAKFVQVNISSDLKETITSYSNNQNAVKPRDSRANDPMQIRLQNEFKRHYSEQFWFEIKRGEIPGSGEIITNENAGLLLMSFDAKEPWGTHRKYQVFDEKHSELFGRPEVSADRIVMCHEMMKTISDKSDKINNTLFGKYGITKHALLYMLRTILETDPSGKNLLVNPAAYVRLLENREYFGECISKIVDDMIIDVNAEVDELGDDFDYRGKLRDESWVKDLSKSVVGNYQKLVQRKRIDSFSMEWNRLNQ
ncbi:MAG: AIPR family protein [Candidatus Bathyarchaeia archaeon]